MHYILHTRGVRRPILGQLRDSQAESRFVASSETKSGRGGRSAPRGVDLGPTDRLSASQVLG